MPYYTEKLNAERLEACYGLAPPRVQQYLRAEVAYVKRLIKPGMNVLELGCGYGRVLPGLERQRTRITGIDSSAANLHMGRQFLSSHPSVALLQMNAAKLGFRDNTFDLVFAIQNGISAFAVDPQTLVSEGYRVVRPGGYLLFSTYTESFWEQRLEWFRLQSAAGLLGEIDWEKTGEGVIVCKDGFRATTFKEDDFHKITSMLQTDVILEEVDQSSLFCVIRKQHKCS